MRNFEVSEDEEQVILGAAFQTHDSRRRASPSSRSRSFVRLKRRLTRAINALQQAGGGPPFMHTDKAGSIPATSVCTAISAAGASVAHGPRIYVVVALLLLLAAGVCRAAGPVVTNVRALQPGRAQPVEIWYNLQDSDSATVRVSLLVSENGGLTWNVPAQSLSGFGFGDSVAPGTDRYIRWNAPADWRDRKSSLVRFRIVASDESIPVGMALIPAGSFQMGNSTNSAEGTSDELPVHTVYVSAFYMDRYEVTKALWDDVYVWATSHGYSFANAGLGKGASHPVHTVSWYDAVKWCNARSEKLGLTPVYYTNNAQTIVYRTDSTNVTNAQVKWDAAGYRLPTQAEREKAARGGLSGKRFPWGDTITHSRANYFSDAGYSYDVSPTRGNHPSYATGNLPYTSPVGSFAPTGYGLYDIVGNVREWCWDWYSSTWYSQSGATASDPKGPATGSDRTRHGGSWNYNASICRAAYRSTGTLTPAVVEDALGFRSVRAAITTADSGNAIVDTTTGAAGNVTVTMHRATANVLETRSLTTAIDEPLWVKGTDRSKLASQPALPGEFNPPQVGLVFARAGLVADGVTPLLFKITPQALPVASSTTYNIEVVQRGGGSFNGGASLTREKLLTLQGTAFAAIPQVALGPTNQEAFAVIKPIKAAEIETSPVFVGAAAVVCDLVVREAITHREVGRYEFGIRKPPIVLVHGYSADAQTWTDDFQTVLRAARGPDFVIPIEYGTAHGAWQNTFGGLNHLATVLNAELRSAVENSQSPDSDLQNSPAVKPELKDWTFTRYDAVGHSQGGVLLRFLSSSQLNPLVGGGSTEITAFEPFRNGANHNVGRFHRVVTIGSPHGGSTVAHLAIRMQDRRVGLPAKLSRIDKFTRLLQKKFMIDNGAADRVKTVQQINRQYVCDPGARIHLLGTTISDSALAYSLLRINSPSRAASLIPLGADGIVDLRSQCASLSGASATNTSQIEASRNVAHAGDPIPVIEIFGTDETHTSSSYVGNRVGELLDGTESVFGSVNVAESFHQTMNDTAAAIETIVTEIQDAERRIAQTMARLPLAPTVRSASAINVSAEGDQVINRVLDPPDGESPNGPVQWDASVYGPSGITTQGLTVQTSGTYGEQLALTIPAAVQGQVVLAVSFPSTSGKTVIGTPHVVLDRPLGNALTAIALDPASIQLQGGAEVALTVSGIYDGTLSSRLFTNAANTTFQSSNAAVATVDADGRVKLLALGTATITTTYDGTLTGTTEVTVLDVAPIVTSSASVSGTVGQALSYQLTASQTAQSFAAAPLPPGLTLNTETGLISGTPTTQGATSALVSVTNSNGTGTKQVDFRIAGLPGAPTDVGLDASGVSEQKPAGTFVGRFATVDPNPLDTFTYQLVAGTGATDNARFIITGDRLFTAAVLNRATTPSVSIRVRTTDSSGATFQKAIVLPVMGPPAITRQPDPRTVFVGESAIFAVETTGLEPLSYQWHRNGVDVPAAGSRILELTSATVADAGNYTVTVWNGDGTITSAAAALVVNRTSYGKWASSLPQTLPGAALEPTGDYNADGIVNFLEFAFGVQPNLGSGVEAQPFVTRDVSGIVLTYREANGIEPLVYRVLKSADLLTWAEHQPALGDVSRVNRGNYTEVHVRIASPSALEFMKINVSTQ